MTVRLRTPLAVLSAAVLAVASLVGAVPPQAADQSFAAGARTAPLTATLPVDPDLTVGRLDNGLRYYIRTNKRPERRAELRLAVNVGSIVEDDDQRGLAHFVEHMAFNGTKNFPKQEIVSFMESIGMRFGPSVNAFTSFDETVYMLQVPTDRPDVLDRALLILEDWAHNLTLDPAEIEKERGVIIEEWRLRRGAGARMLDAQFPTLLKGSPYADRLPIGTVENLQTFPPERLRRFYTDWYRPDLMAVVAVGDFDTAAVERQIRAHFGALPRSESPRPRPTYEVPDNPGTLFAIATDPEAPSATVSVYSKMTLRDPTTVGAYRQQLVESLFGGMLSTRFGELAQKPDAPFIGASAGRGLFVRSKEASMLTALVKDNEIDRGLEALFIEAERVARHGFTETELARLKTNMLRSYERAVVEKANRQSGTLAAEYIRNFTEREPIPGIDYEHELAKRFVPDITLAEVNSLAREWAPEGNRVVLVSAPKREGLAVPTEARLAEVMKTAAGATIEPYVDTVGGRALLDPIPEPGRVATRSGPSEFGITEWTLANGVKVVLMPTTLREDEIVFRAFSPGGTSLAPDADFIPAATATQVIGAGGLGPFSSIELRKVLTGKVASVRASITDTHEGLSGSASKKDLETLFQLIYMNVTQPRADRQIFGVLTMQSKAMLANQMQTPGFAFGTALRDALTQNHPRTRPTTPETIDKMDLDKSLAFYQDRFADAGDFTFVFAGSFDPPTLEPLVARYLGSLPATRRSETWKDIGVHAPRGVVVRRVEKGIEPQSQTAIVFTGPFEYAAGPRTDIRAMALVLQTRLRERLREDLGGTYSVSVSASYEKIPTPEYAVSVTFGSSPDRTDALVNTVFEMIRSYLADGPTPQEVADVKQTLLRELETNMEQNGYLVAQIAFRYQYDEDVAGFFHVADRYHAITARAIQAAARLYLDEKNYVRVSLFPER